jgi:hypothetical protein
MARGGKREGAGRPKGSPNKDAALAREAIARFVDTNSGMLQEWLDEIKDEHGALAAFKCVTDLIEYHVPKLARTETSGPDGGPQRHSISWEK